MFIQGRSSFTSPLAAGLGLALLSGAPTSTFASPQAAPAPERAALMDLFEAAAQEWGVPAQLLISVSYTAGQWFPDTISHRGDGTGEAGHMGLRTYDTGPSAALAASLIGATREEVLTEPLQNIRGGAALLATFAREANGGRPVPAELTAETAAPWWAALGRYAGVESEVHADAFARSVVHALQTGLEGVSPRGEWVVTPPTMVPELLEDWSAAAESALVAERIKAQKTNATDYPGATWVPACSSNYSNYSRTAADIYYVIIHVAQGSYNGTISWFQNCSAGVSSHYVVSKGGAVTQMVREEDVAWHAGNWDYNLKSVGIEHEGYISDPASFTEAMYEASAALTANICDRNGIPKNRTYIIGHNEVPGCPNSGGGGSGCHTDPGQYWNWNHYMDLVTGGGSSNPTGDLIGVVAEGDIYTGPRIAGATVRLNTGASASSNSSGTYEFVGIDVATYTVTASAPGYQSASRTCSVQANVDNWCSIALTPAAEPTPEPTPAPTPTPTPDPGGGGCSGRVSGPMVVAASAAGDGAGVFTALVLVAGVLLRGRRRR